MELRWRVVRAFKAGEGTYDSIAERFMVGRASVSRWVALERATGDVVAKPMGGARQERRIDAEGEEMLRTVLEDVPDSTLEELVDLYEEERGIRVGVRTMGRCVARLGLTRKRGR
ncbi:MAG: helix-turn-helix domain-containing protein [Alphaproteobacteria bacterium]|nr:helix-turn-helix domain-containing protein [Alphaproteobacteria bacterium]